MTLAPIENRRVRAVAAERYPLNKICAHPECGEPTKDPHHCFRRGAIGGDSWFVEIEQSVGLVVDDSKTVVIPHVTGICRAHHDDVTEHRAWVKLEEGVFVWYDRNPPCPTTTGCDCQEECDNPEPWAPLGPLSPQPGSVEQPPKVRSAVGRGEISEVPLPPRPKRTWALSVPRDHYEDGYEVVETLIGAAAEILGRRDHRSFKYYTLVEVLAVFVRDYKGVDPSSGEGA